MLPEGWVEEALGSVSEITTGGTPSRSVAEYWGGDIPWMSSGEINQRIVREVAEKITPAGMANSNARILAPGTIMMALNGQGKTRGKVAMLDVEASCNQSLAGIIVSRRVAEPEYVFYYLESIYKDIRNITGDDARNGLNLRILRSISVAIPPLNEQRRIVKVLRSMDEVEAAGERASKAAETVLRSYLTEAFHGAADQEAGQSLESLLLRIIDYRGVPPPKADSGIPLITAKNVRFGFLDPEPREFIAERDYDGWMRRGIPAAGDILFTTEAPLGLVAEFPAYKAALGQRTITLVADPERIDRAYLKWLLLSPPVQELVHRHATGSTAKGIKQSTFRKLKVSVPPLGDQREIAAACESMWDVVIASRSEASRMLIVKKQVAADLLSGRARVPA